MRLVGVFRVFAYFESGFRRFLAVLESFDELQRFLHKLRKAFFVVWGVEKRDGVIESLLHHVALVAEGFESVESVVVACAAVADSAEWDGKVLNLDDGVVHACGAGPGFGENALDVAAIFAENV